MADLSHIKMFECEEHLGPYLRPKVVLFNSNRISLEEAFKYVRAGEFNENVLCLDKIQFISLFRDGKDQADN